MALNGYTKSFEISLRSDRDALIQLQNTGVWLSEGGGWTISSIDEHYINTLVYDVLRGSSYIPLPLGL